MAAGAPPADDAADLLKNLSLDSQTKPSQTIDPVKKPSVDAGNGQIQPSNNAVTPLVTDFMDPTLAYYPTYYYGGYDGATNDWDVYPRYMFPDGVDLAHGVYGYGYGPYGNYSLACLPVPTTPHDGQLYGAQHYQYPSQYFNPLTPTGGPYPATASPLKGETTTPAISDQPSLADGTIKGSVGNGVGPKGNTGPAPVKSTPYPMSGLSTSTGYINRMYPNKLYSQYGNMYRSGYGMDAYALHTNGRGWLSVDNKVKPRVQAGGLFGYNNEHNDGLNELNRGPRARTTKNQKPLTPIVIAVKGQNISFSSSDDVKDESIEVKEVKVTPDREQYNKTDFPETYVDAKFFIIKSYSEDDVHKSIKYNVWSSTQNGNKKLDAAYHEAQQKSEGCPVFLFFSVNTSGQFVGVAEMVGPVDFNKSLEYWQQDKWIGCFPVKWHIVKDLPNSLLKHIILEYNENKPVTNSRDTQEVKLVQGLQMINIFKEHSSKQCILDDFEFYEDRQKKIQQKKAKQQQFQKQSWEGKPIIDKKIKEGIEGVVLKSVDGMSDLVNEVKLVDNVQDDVAKPTGMNVVLNGVANAC